MLMLSVLMTVKRQALPGATRQIQTDGRMRDRKLKADNAGIKHAEQNRDTTVKQAADKEL